MRPAFRPEGPVVAVEINAAVQRLRTVGESAPVLPVALGVVLYSTGPVMVQASSTTGPVFSFWRLWFGVVVLGAATLVQGAITGRWPRRDAWRWSVGAGAAFGIHQLTFFTAVKATSVADVTLIGTLSPIVTALLALPFFLERPGWRFRTWSVVAMAGTAVVVTGGASGPTGDPVGMALAVGNVLFFAVFFLLSKGSRQHLAVLPFLFGVMTAGALTVSGYVLVAREPTMSVTSTDLLLAFIVAAGPGAIGHFVMTWPLQWLPANVPPVMRLAMPLLAGLWAWWFLGEGITLWHVAGGAITIAGVAGALLSPSGRAFVAGERRR